jgi:SAM-dependent methyltransferase
MKASSINQKIVTSHQRDICRLCCSKNLELVVRLDPTPVAEKYLESPEHAGQVPVYPLNLYMCSDCGHVQLLHIIDPEFLYRDFNYRSAGTRSLLEHFEQTAESVACSYKFDSHPLAVDIGSNDGSLLKFFKNRGFNVLGVDPAVEIAAEASTAGVPTLSEFLTPKVVQHILSNHGPAAVVCAFNVFAHTDDLEGMTSCIRDLLAPNGIFVFECSYLKDILEKMLLGTIFHEHLSHHSIAPLRAFLERLGLELIDVQQNDIQGGSIVGIAQRKWGCRPVLPSVENFIVAERDMKLQSPETVKEFSQKLTSIRTEISSFTQAEKKQGKRFWGFGAARSGTTLMAQLDLGNVIERIVDDNPSKQNKFTPLYGIPVVATEHLYHEKPDFAFILAWIHASKIVASHQRYLEEGGKFITCFPRPCIIGNTGIVPL